MSTLRLLVLLTLRLCIPLLSLGQKPRTYGYYLFVHETNTVYLINYDKELPYLLPQAIGRQAINALPASPCSPDGTVSFNSDERRSREYEFLGFDKRNRGCYFTYSCWDKNIQLHCINALKRYQGVTKEDVDESDMFNLTLSRSEDSTSVVVASAGKHSFKSYRGSFNSDTFTGREDFLGFGPDNLGPQRIKTFKFYKFDQGPPLSKRPVYVYIKL